MAVHEVKAYRLHITLLYPADELGVREIIHECLTQLNRNIRLLGKHYVILPSVVCLTTDTPSLACEADVAGLGERLDNLLLLAINSLL